MVQRCEETFGNFCRGGARETVTGAGRRKTVVQWYHLCRWCERNFTGAGKENTDNRRVAAARTGAEKVRKGNNYFPEVELKRSCAGKRF